jgi:mannan endo-1,4-beta-mannosidase
MRSRLVTVAAVTIAAASVSAVAIGLPSGGPAGSAGTVAAHASLRTAPDSYLGVYEPGEPGSYAAIARFATVAGRTPNLDGYYSGWPEPFKLTFARLALRHDATALVQMDPADASVAAVAAGTYDDYLRAYADSVRDFGHPVVIGFGHEMNATWYSWGYGHLAPRTFVKAWRHVVTLFRQQGADNVTWLWTIQADVPGSGPIADWWPGAEYVSWIGIDGYYYLPSNTFATVFGPTIVQVRTFSPKPILISESSVGPQAGQTTKIPDLFRGMAAYRMLGIVWFDITQNAGLYHQDWRIEGKPQAESAFRRSARRYLHYGP